MTTLKLQCEVDWPGFAMDVSLELPARGISVLFGPSGCGKTTILRTVAGLQSDVRGRVEFRGQVWQDAQHFTPAHQRPVGYVFQEASLFPHLTVMGNLRYGMKRSSDSVLVELDHLIELLGIEHLLDRRPERLSGGERQRVGIARALAVNPQLLLMDEPLAALDLARKREILPFLERLHRELSIPILYVTHSPDEVARLADHLVVLEQGNVVGAGSLKELMQRIDLPFKLGDDHGVIIEATVARVDAQWHLAEMHFDGGSLWIRDAGLAVGVATRLQIFAGDVSLARDKPSATSIQNLLQGSVVEVANGEHPGLMLVRVAVGSACLIARVTARAWDALGLSVGEPVWLQVKTVALVN